MALDFVDVAPLMRKLYVDHVKSGSTAANLTSLADEIASAVVSLSGGRSSVTIGGVTSSIKATSIVGVRTADGIIVTDFSLFLRDLLLALTGPTIGQMPKHDPYTIADAVRAATLRFFSGGSTGGMIYDSSSWQISPAWLPVPEIAPVQAVSSLIDSPIARTLASIYASDADSQRDLQKALSTAADPNFSLLAIGGTTMLTISSPFESRASAAAFDGWAPTFVYSGNSADEDVVRRPSTFVPNSDYADWRSDAYDALAGPGYVLHSLQLPRLFTHPSILHRVQFDETGCWFQHSGGDYKLVGLTESLVNAVRANPFGYKMGWLDSLRGVPLPPAVSLTAFSSSPLAHVTMSADFRSDASRAAPPRLILTQARRAWIRSDPSIDLPSRWLADTICSSIGKPWIDAISPTLYATLSALS